MRSAHQDNNPLSFHEQVPSAEFDVENISTKKEQSSSLRVRRRVHFLPFVEINEILHRDDYTDEEQDNCWYTKHEKAEIKQEMVQTLRLAMVGVDPELHNMTLRGLEPRIGAGVVERQQNVLRAMIAVLEEQEYQIALGISEINDIAIQRVYLRESLHCIQSAQEMGEADAIHVLKELKQQEEEEEGEEKGGGRRGMKNKKKSKIRCLSFLKKKFKSEVPPCA